MPQIQGKICEEAMGKKDIEDKNTPNLKKTVGKKENKEVEINDDSVNEDTSAALEESDESPYEKLEAELAEAKDKYLRLYSEFDNYRRRTAKEKLEMMQTAGEKIVVSLLPVIDDFARAEQSLAAGDTQSIIEGMKLISDKFMKQLVAEGLKKMDTSPGSDFDPEYHDAITQVPAPSKKLKGKIVDTIEEGYFLGDKVIRHAKVVTGA